MIDIRPGDLDDPLILALLDVHLALARAVSPPESTHALDVGRLKAAEIAFWAAWDGESLLGVGALAELEQGHGEVKSMHVAEAARGRGIGGAMVRHIIDAARARGHRRISLETGAMPYFAPARAMYRRHGFRECGPFGRYGPDANSVFMTLKLHEDPPASP